MTMKIYVLICAILLIGCADDESGNSDVRWRWSGVITEQSANFILTHDIDAHGSIIVDVERWWSEVQQCTGISIVLNQPLIIEYVPAIQVQPFIGWISWRDRYIRVATIDLFFFNDGYTTKHEMIHYILFLISTSDTDNENHNSVLFEYCKGV